MMRSIFSAASLGLLLFSSSAFAGGIGVVDFQKAINEVKEGKSAKSKIDSMFSQKRTALQQKEKELKDKVAAYEQQKSLLSPTARQEQEQSLMQMQMQLQQLLMQSEQEVQQIYAKEMESLISKMKDISATLGKEKDLDLILEATESGVVYKSSSVVDLTSDVIKRYDAKYGG